MTFLKSHYILFWQHMSITFHVDSICPLHSLWTRCLLHFMWTTYVHFIPWKQHMSITFHMDNICPLHFLWTLYVHYIHVDKGCPLHSMWTTYVHYIPRGQHMSITFQVDNICPLHFIWTTNVHYISCWQQMSRGLNLQPLLRCSVESVSLKNIQIIIFVWTGDNVDVPLLWCSSTVVPKK